MEGRKAKRRSSNPGPKQITTEKDNGRKQRNGSSASRKVADWNVVNTYGSPTAAGRRCIGEVATNVFEGSEWLEEAWLWGGHFNDTPEQSGATAIAASQGGETVKGCEGGTRWGRLVWRKKK